ncbi:alpha-(1,6)-fucosyltransferase-like, partial [Penaeus monodon]|uniref:alpha-(1,6)-fucosyltransferase-like n=1 Tax=Penaeus monodon TaxID=6687 RepID=UPI0018A76313
MESKETETIANNWCEEGGDWKKLRCEKELNMDVGKHSYKVVQFPDSDKPVPRPKYLPRGVPKDIAQRLMNAHGDPFAWWMGQLIKYTFRLNGEFKEYVKELSSRLGYESPIVGNIKKYRLTLGQICRLAYELMLTLHPDADRKVFSVDSLYLFHNQNARVVAARYPHTPRRAGELQLQDGDFVKITLKYLREIRNLHNGFQDGRNLRTKAYGLYPVYKTVEALQVADTPSFDLID